MPTPVSDRREFLRMLFAAGLACPLIRPLKLFSFPPPAAPFVPGIWAGAGAGAGGITSAMTTRPLAVNTNVIFELDVDQSTLQALSVRCPVHGVATTTRQQLAELACGESISVTHPDGHRVVLFSPFDARRPPQLSSP